MLDQYGRRINYLRISVTDRCNLRCRYCMPEGVQDVGMKNILTFEEIWEIVKTGVSLGITHIRITGGEPLVRKGCADLILGIRKIPGVEIITADDQIFSESTKPDVGTFFAKFFDFFIGQQTHLSVPVPRMGISLDTPVLYQHCLFDFMFRCTSFFTDTDSFDYSQSCSFLSTNFYHLMCLRHL